MADKISLQLGCALLEEDFKDYLILQVVLNVKVLVDSFVTSFDLLLSSPVKTVEYIVDHIAEEASFDSFPFIDFFMRLLTYLLNFLVIR